MISRRTAEFRAAFDALPTHIQTLARDAYRRFRENPHHPSLRFRRVRPNEPIYAVRIGLHDRAVGRLNGDVIIWYWIGHHAEYDRLLAAR
jgi:hypothetical protein